MKKLLLFLIISNPILTFSQTLDPTFGSNKGIVYNQFSTSNTDDLVSSAALQSDGNIIIVGTTSEYGYTGFISRVYPTGSLDTSFNNGGYKLISGPQEAVAIQSDGKILVAGRMVLTRLNSDGSNDTTFNNSGKITLTINGYNMKIKTLSILTNGKIMVTGYVSNGTDDDFVLVRLNINGTLDTLFDLDGITTLELLGSNETLFATGIQPDGKIVIAGRRGITTSTTDYIIARFNSIGSLDTSFGTNGLVTSTTGIQSLDFQSDGKIVAAGVSDNSTSSYSTSTSSTSLYAKRYNTDGSLDTAFNVIKTAYRSSNTYQKPQIKCLSSGKILLSGTYTNLSMANNEFALNQFNSNGTFDTSFSATGAVNLGAGISNTSINSLSSFLIVKPDGKILTGGSVHSYTTKNGENFRIEFIQTSSTGVMEYFHDLNLKQGVDYIDSAIEQPSGKTVVMVFSKIGYLSAGTLLIRYNQNGTIDNSFGLNGNVYLSGMGMQCSMKQQLDGKILISITNPDSSTISIYRFLMDGALDTSFGQANVGFVTLLGYSYGRRGVDIAVSNEGSIYVANRYMRNSYGVTKLNYDGSVDSSYGSYYYNGTASTRFDFYSNTETEYPMNLILNPDNSVVVVGVLSNGQPEDSNYMLATGIVKFNKFGIIDDAFGVNGKLILENNNYIYSHDFLVDANSNLYLSSNIKDGSITTKFSSNGIIDTTYGTNGVVTSSYYSGSMLMQPDGKILKTNSINSQFGITRYNINGTLDTTFGTAGFINTPIYYSSSISKLLLLSSGKLLAVGNSFNGSNSIMAMARYTNLNLGTLGFSNKEFNFMVYPNPIQEQATFAYTLKESTDVTIEIIDLQGKVVQSVLNSKNQLAGDYQQNIILPSSLPTGNYLLRFSSSIGNQTIKIIKK